MHALSIVPAIVFFLIYVIRDRISLFIMILLLILFGINIYRYIKKKDLLQFLIILSLVGSFFLYDIYKLGNTKVPQTFTDLTEDQSVTLFNFSKPQQIDKICYFIGINENVNFVLEYQDKNTWKKFYSYDEKNFPFSYRWKCAKSKIKTSKILLRITKDAMMLNEVRFMHKDKIVEYTANRKNLNDEPEMAVDTSYHSSMFFDEIYHGRTAYEIINNRWIYENTHPYLGKILIGLGIKAFGMTPFGWRIVNVLFAGLMIYIAYLFAIKLFKEEIYGYSAAFLMTYSFMHLTQSRFAHIDTFGVLFVFISYLFLYLFIIKQHLRLLIYSAIFFGLASAVKWSAVFASFGFVAISIYLLISKYPLQKRFEGYKLLLYGILSYALISVIVYALTFYDIYLRTGSFQEIINYNLNMFDYHSAIDATHAYSSQWWSWMLDMKPMCYYRNYENTLVSSITVFGNPAIFWMGLISIFYLIIKVIRKFSLEPTFILLAFLSLYLPYIFVDRLMFIYHFYYALPFMILAIVYMLKDIVERFEFYRNIYFVYFVIVASLFLLFYPVLSGYAIEKTYIDTWLKWSSAWWL